MIQLRPYQLDNAAKGLEILRNYWIVYLAFETRTGKTLTALEIARRTGLEKVLFVTKKKAIQSIESDYQKMNPDFDLTVINYESVTKVGKGFDLIICDEAHSCFLGNTTINGKKIKDIKVGSLQKSFNFVTGKYENKKVLNVFKNKLTENLIKIKCNGKEIVCTESHKIYTKRGWVKARDILSTDELQVV